ncbi:hypothetical protein [Dyadobacter crusticola]|uniref:hypothetical protein n=1 Tax=Dyadobacter crusticola TaxID=292407 RepID=UPI0004E2201E|nr:hypothetical protein [Dyadobacter crusticola]
MSTINKAKYLSLLILLGAWGCTNNQQISRSGGYDDLYGGGPASGVVTRDRGADQELSRTDNPDYSYTGEYAENGTSDYYDESYLTSKGVKRAVSTDVGYNAGFVDGYNEASRFSNFGNMGSYWPGMMSVGMRFGYGNSFRFSPYMGMGFGMGSMLGYSPFGYSPWGYGGGMMAYGYDPFGYSSPWGFGNPYGFYDGFYGGGYGFGGYGYSPWAYSRPVIVVNSPERGVSRTYGPRVVTNGTRGVRNATSAPSRSSGVVGDRGGRRASNAISANDNYVSPRSSRSYNRGESGNPGGRTASGNYSSRGSSEGNNVYYSRPRQGNASTYSEPRSGTSDSYSPRSSRSSSTYTAPSYTPSRSQSDYSSPARTYTPSRSEYSAPSRTYSAPSYSAPSRSYSAPSGGGGGEGRASSPSSRGPR